MTTATNLKKRKADSGALDLTWYKSQADADAACVGAMFSVKHGGTSSQSVRMPTISSLGTWQEKKTWKFTSSCAVAATPSWFSILSSTSHRSQPTPKSGC